MTNFICDFCHLFVIENRETHVPSCYEEQLIAIKPYLGILYGDTKRVDMSEEEIRKNMENKKELKKMLEAEAKLKLELETEKNKKEKQEEIQKNIQRSIKFTDCQKKSLKYAIKKSKIMTHNTKHMLLEKIIALKHNPEDLQTLMDYADKLNVIMFLPLFSANLIDKFNEDCRLKNLFEVNTGRGCTDKNTRAKWETTLFNGLYDKAEPSERVKYGSLNIDSNPDGVISTKGYGDSYVILKQETKFRVTLVYGDSSGVRSHLYIGTPKYLGNILNYIPDDLLDTAVKVAKGQNINYKSYQYIEAQIHGELRMDRDIDSLVIKHANYVGTRGEDVVKMCTKFGINLVVSNTL